MGNQSCRNDNYSSVQLKNEQQQVNNYKHYENYAEMERKEDKILGNIQTIRNLVDNKEYFLKQIILKDEKEVEEKSELIKRISEIQSENLVQILGFKAVSYGGRLQCGSNFKVNIIIEKFRSELKSSLKENHLNYNEPYYIQMFSEIIVGLYEIQMKDMHLPDISIDNLVYSSAANTNNNRQNIVSTQKKVIFLYDLYSDHNKSQYHRHLYYSPQKLKFFKNLNSNNILKLIKADKKYNQIHNVVFQLAIIFIEIVHKKPQNDLYNDLLEFNFDLLKKRIKDIQFQNIKQLLQLMLEKKEKNRPDFIQLKTIIDNYKQDQRHIIQSVSGNDQQKQSDQDKNAYVYYSTIYQFNSLIKTEENKVNNGDEYNKLGQDIDKYIQNYEIRKEQSSHYQEQGQKNIQNYSEYYQSYNEDISDLMQRKNESCENNSGNNMNKDSNLDNRKYVENYKNGGRYEGRMKNNQRNGKGIFYFKDGGYYEGEWENNKMNGEGCLYYQNNLLAYKGSWRDDQFHGKGILFNNQNLEEQDIEQTHTIDYNLINIDLWIKYEGIFQYDNKNGQGHIVFKNGSYYQGQFKNDNLDGNGKFYGVDGTYIQGVWNNNKLIQTIDSQFDQINSQQINQIRKNQLELAKLKQQFDQYNVQNIIHNHNHNTPTKYQQNDQQQFGNYYSTSSIGSNNNHNNSNNNHNNSNNNHNISNNNHNNSNNNHNNSNNNHNNNNTTLIQYGSNFEKQAYDYDLYMKKQRLSVKDSIVRETNQSYDYSPIKSRLTADKQQVIVDDDNQ